LGSVLCALAYAVLRGDALGVDRAGPLAFAVAAVGPGVRVLRGGPRLALRATSEAHGRAPAAR
jgi:hypothetical protein